MRPGQTSHSNSTHFVAPDLNAAGAIHLPFPRASSITPVRCQKRQFGRVTSRTIFDSSVGQPQNYRGGTRKPVGWQAGCAESVPLKLSGITGLIPSGREAPCTWKPLSRPIDSPRYCALHIPDPAAPLHTFPSGLSRACRTGRKKLIFSSTVVKDSSCARVLANAMLIAASAMSQGIPSDAARASEMADERTIGQDRPSPLQSACLCAGGRGKRRMRASLAGRDYPVSGPAI
jgi:hypothetical protein